MAKKSNTETVAIRAAQTSEVQEAERLVVEIRKLHTDAQSEVRRLTNLRDTSRPKRVADCGPLKEILADLSASQLIESHLSKEVTLAEQARAKALFDARKAIAADLNQERRQVQKACVAKLAVALDSLRDAHAEMVAADAESTRLLDGERSSLPVIGLPGDFAVRLGGILNQWLPEVRKAAERDA